MIIHNMACLWIMAAKMSGEYNWIAAYENGVAIEGYFEEYLIAFYFISTTITTVGYGDISAKNSVERVFSIFMLFVGVMCFSFASGSLTSIITSYDNA